MSSNAARERCFGKHELVCAGYHTRLIRITSKINSPELASTVCEACLAEIAARNSRQKDIDEAIRALEMLMSLMDSPTKHIERQSRYIADLKIWFEGMEKRAKAEQVKRRIGHQGWILSTSPVGSRGLSAQERQELGEAMCILDTPLKPKPTGFSIEDVKSLFFDTDSTVSPILPLTKKSPRQQWIEAQQRKAKRENKENKRHKSWGNVREMIYFNLYQMNLEEMLLGRNFSSWTPC
ncbi:hypothetical protein BDZ91DRAFT_768866 [Kalaharituber pfeilii]|nr:hypothetical protein BDZ91DRAFT_768866 [Kalaharituber pfeilii]